VVWRSKARSSVLFGSSRCPLVLRLDRRLVCTATGGVGFGGGGATGSGRRCRCGSRRSTRSGGRCILSCLAFCTDRTPRGGGCAAGSVVPSPPTTLSTLWTCAQCGADHHAHLSSPFALSGFSVGQRGIFAQTTQPRVPKALNYLHISVLFSMFLHSTRVLCQRGIANHILYL
jgi:hypothetical protein